jgi:hypothetical protein
MRAANLAERLTGVKASSGGGFLALCPAHEDRSPSLSFRDGDKAVLLNCFAGCDLDSILNALNITKPDLLFDQGPKIDAAYDYVDEQGQLLFQTVRYLPKYFKQRRPDGAGGWIWNLKDTRRVLYRLQEVQKASCILLLEGEKDVETAYRLGLPEGWAATCNPMGAGKWRQEYSEALSGKWVCILPDADEPGRKHAESIAQSLQGKAVRVNRLTLPEGLKDLSEWSAPGNTAGDLQALFDSAEEFPFIAALVANNSIPARGTPIVRGSPEWNSGFRPVAVSQLLAEPPEGVEWVLDELFPAGGLVVIAGKPKEGKTTFCTEAAVKVALGLPFLGRQTKKSGVLILALEEHARDVVIRLQNLGATALEGLYVHRGPLEPSADVFNGITAFAKEQAVRLILIDTLSAFWKIENENDAAEVTRVIKPLVALARESGACVVLIHHARKSEGQYGDEIRGSGALFAAVDVALILKRHEIQTQRKLQAQSRYPETPGEIILELRESGYVALGDPAAAGKAVRLAKLLEVLSDQWEQAETLAKKAGISHREGRRLLGILVEKGEAIIDGKGCKGSPFVYQRNSIPAGVGAIGRNRIRIGRILFRRPPVPLPEMNPAMRRLTCMLIEALQPLTVKLRSRAVHMTPGHPVDLPEDDGLRLLVKAKGKVRLIANHRPIIEPAHPFAKPTYFEDAFGRILGPVIPEFLARADGHFWIVTTFEGEARWIRSDRLRSRQVL